MPDWAFKLVIALVIILASWIAAHFAAKIVKNLISRSGAFVSGSIFVNLARTAIWITGLCIILNLCFNVDMTGVIAALGVGGIAISLGFQDTLANLIGGLLITVGHVVQTDDWVEVVGIHGKVTDIDWRQTTIVDVDGKSHYIPNSVISKNSLRHLGTEAEVTVTVALPTSTDLEAFRTAACNACDEALGDALAPGTHTRISYNGSTDYGIEGIIWSHVIHDELTPSRARDAMTCAVAPLLKELGPTEKW